MTSYEICKKLKDAGYPLLYANHPAVLANYDFGNGLYVIAPTLSELIEAIGDKFLLIKLNLANPQQTRWEAGSYSDKKTIQEFGPTPEIAAANLYLALKAKQ